MRLNKLAKKIFAAGLAVSLMMANAGVSFAADYQTVTGGTVTAKKTMTIEADAKVPAVTYTYKVTALDNAASQSGTVEDVTISFSNADTITDGKVVKDINLNFGAVTYKEPGVYSYEIEETQSAPAPTGLVNNNSTKRYARVYVVDDSTDTAKKLKVQIVALLTEEDKDLTDDEITDAKKTAGFDCEYKTFPLTFRKEVTGNQASRDKYFEFTVKLNNVADGTKYTVDITNAEASPVANSATTYSSMANPTELTATANGVEQTFYLQHGQEITIKGIGNGTGYTVTEKAEDYTSSTALAKEGFTDATEGTVSKEIKTGYLNTKNGVIPTGVILDSAPFILIIGLAAAALIFTAARKRVR